MDRGSDLVEGFSTDTSDIMNELGGQANAGQNVGSLDHPAQQTEHELNALAVAALSENPELLNFEDEDYDDYGDYQGGNGDGDFNLDAQSGNPDNFDFSLPNAQSHQTMPTSNGSVGAADVGGSSAQGTGKAGSVASYSQYQDQNLLGLGSHLADIDKPVSSVEGPASNYGAHGQHTHASDNNDDSGMSSATQHEIDDSNMPPNCTALQAVRRNGDRVWYKGMHDQCVILLDHAHDVDGGVYFDNYSSMAKAFLAMGENRGEPFLLGLSTGLMVLQLESHATCNHELCIRARDLAQQVVNTAMPQDSPWRRQPLKVPRPEIAALLLEINTRLPLGYFYDPMTDEVVPCDSMPDDGSLGTSLLASMGLAPWPLGLLRWDGDLTQVNAGQNSDQQNGQGQQNLSSAQARRGAGVNDLNFFQNNTYNPPSDVQTPASHAQSSAPRPAVSEEQFQAEFSGAPISRKKTAPQARGQVDVAARNLIHGDAAHTNNQQGCGQAGTSTSAAELVYGVPATKNSHSGAGQENARRQNQQSTRQFSNAQQGAGQQSPHGQSDVQPHTPPSHSQHIQGQPIRSQTRHGQQKRSDVLTRSARPDRRRNDQ